MEVRAVAKYIRVSPQKVRRIVDMVRGMRVSEALTLLRFVPSPAAREVAKVIRSAAANAENNFQMSGPDLHIVKIAADQGPMLKRYRARAHGRVSPILKRTSHITVVVDEKVR